MTLSPRLNAYLRARRANLLASLALMLLTCASAPAQDDLVYQVRGRVVESPSSETPVGESGASLQTASVIPVPKAEVTLIAEDASVPVASPTSGVSPGVKPDAYSVSTDAEGYFTLPKVKQGNYYIRVKAKDYELDTVRLELYTRKVTEIVIEIDPYGNSFSQVKYRFTQRRKPGSKAIIRALYQRRTLVDARRDGAYPVRTVNQVSLGGASLTRSYDELAFYLPGIAAPPQTFSNFVGPGFGPGIGTSGQFSANGLRSRANNFTVDGSDNNDEDIGVRRQGFLALVSQPVESIHEYQVITAVAPAQFGRNLGAQVNAVSQFGTSRVNGTLYGTFSTSRLNAADFFDTTGGNTTLPLTAQVGSEARPVVVDGRPAFVNNRAGRKDRFTFGQFGGTLGGPVLQSPNEKGWNAFYFFSGEFQGLKATKETHFAVPTVEQRGLLGTGATGLEHDPFTGATLNAHPTAAQGDAIFSFFPFPNNPQGVYDRNTFSQEIPTRGLGYVLSGRLDADKVLSGRRHQFISRYNHTRDYRDVPAIGGALFSTIRPDVRAQNLSLFVNSLLSSPDSSTLLSNQLFLSYGQTRFDFEHRPDTEFLIPSRTNLRSAEERRFLINARLLQNVTLPGDNSVNYVTNPLATAEARLGTPFELLSAPVGQIFIAGFSPVGVDVFTFPQKRTNNTYQISDTVTLQTGNHTAAFGVDVRRSELNSQLPRNSRPLITFNGGAKVRPTTPQGPPFEVTGRFSALDLAATGAPNGVFQTLTTGDDSTIGLRYYQYNFFVSDEWRVRPNLSLSYGLRYEYNTPPREQHRRIENTFDEPILERVGIARFINPPLGTGESAEVNLALRRSRGIFLPDRNNFAPRLGLAYSFGREDANIIRVGGGIFYDQVPGVVVSQSRNVVPTFITFNTAGIFESQQIAPGRFRSIGLGILLPSTLPIGCGNSGRIPVNTPGTLNTINSQVSVECLLDTYLLSNNGIFGFQPVLQTVLPAAELQMPMAYHYTASFERELGAAETVISVAYVGTQGRHLLRQTTPNLGDNAIIALPAVILTDDRPRFAGFVAQPVQRDAFGELQNRTSRSGGTLRIYEASANSRYDALQLQLRGRFLPRALYQFNYTLSKVTDDASDVFELAGAPALPANSLTRAGERAPANFDARHIFSGFIVYNLPAFRGGGFARRLFGDWQVTGKTRFQTGQPFTVNTFFDVNADGNLTDRLNTTEGLVRTGDRRQPLLLNADPMSLLAESQRDGVIGRNTFRAGSIFDFDLSFMKTFSFEEEIIVELPDADGNANLADGQEAPKVQTTQRTGKSRQLRLRVDMFNVFNRANFGVPVRYLEAAGFGRAVNTVTPPRRLQFSLRYLF
ncbi:MAG TPA: carboxypeptidase-like regulatory domain-containing protein [Pyrinomonadaceae bacterium]|jgi:hypothetical protein